MLYLWAQLLMRVDSVAWFVLCYAQTQDSVTPDDGRAPNCLLLIRSEISWHYWSPWRVGEVCIAAPFCFCLPSIRPVSRIGLQPRCLLLSPTSLLVQFTHPESEYSCSRDPLPTWVFLLRIRAWSVCLPGPLVWTVSTRQTLSSTSRM